MMIVRLQSRELKTHAIWVGMTGCGLTTSAYAEKTAETWQKGLEDWGQSGNRTQKHWTQQKSRSTQLRAVRGDKSRCSSFLMHRPPSCEMTLKRFEIDPCRQSQTCWRAERVACSSCTMYPKTSQPCFVAAGRCRIFVAPRVFSKLKFYGTP